MSSLTPALRSRCFGGIRQSLRFRQIDPVVSITVIGELLYGATPAQNSEQQHERIAQLLAVSTILGLDEATAEQYAAVKRSLELRVQRIPENDMWIAASALQHRLPIATRDSHFERITGLAVEQW